MNKITVQIMNEHRTFAEATGSTQYTLSQKNIAMQIKIVRIYSFGVSMQVDRAFHSWYANNVFWPQEFTWTPFFIHGFHSLLFLSFRLASCSFSFFFFLSLNSHGLKHSTSSPVCLSVYKILRSGKPPPPFSPPPLWHSEKFNSIERINPFYTCSSSPISSYCFL